MGIQGHRDRREGGVQGRRVIRFQGRGQNIASYTREHGEEQFPLEMRNQAAATFPRISAPVSRHWVHFENKNILKDLEKAKSEHYPAKDPSL